MADNDLALGQLVELVSQSPIWKDSAIIVQEDDSQDGIDSVDAHRIPAFVISPWARRGGAAVSTRYDQYSLLRTASCMLGLRPLSLNDALATPLYDAFISGAEQPDVEGTRYRAIQPEQSLTEVNPPSAPNARLSAALPWDKADAVPQRLADRIIWQSVFGAGSTPPPPGPNASPAERARATGALRRFQAGRSTRTFLTGSEEGPGRRRAPRSPPTCSRSAPGSRSSRRSAGSSSWRATRERTTRRRTTRAERPCAPLRRVRGSCRVMRSAGRNPRPRPEAVAMRSSVVALSALALLAPAPAASGQARAGGGASAGGPAAEAPAAPPEAPAATPTAPAPAGLAYGITTSRRTNFRSAPRAAAAGSPGSRRAPGCG